MKKKIGLIITVVLIVCMAMSVFTGCNTDDAKGGGGGGGEKEFTQAEMNTFGETAIMGGLLNAAMTGSQLDTKLTLKERIGEKTVLEIKDCVTKLKMDLLAGATSLLPIDMSFTATVGGQDLTDQTTSVVLKSGTIYINALGEKYSLKDADIFMVIGILSALGDPDAMTGIIATATEETAPGLADILGDLKYSEDGNAISVTAKVNFADIDPSLKGISFDLVFELTKTGEGETATYAFNKIYSKSMVDIADKPLNLDFSVDFSYPAVIGIAAPTDADTYNNLSYMIEGIINTMQLSYFEFSGYVGQSSATDNSQLNYNVKVDTSSGAFIEAYAGDLNGTFNRTKLWIDPVDTYASFDNNIHQMEKYKFANSELYQSANMEIVMGMFMPMIENGKTPMPPPTGYASTSAETDVPGLDLAEVIKSINYTSVKDTSAKLEFIIDTDAIIGSSDLFMDAKFTIEFGKNVGKFYITKISLTDMLGTEDNALDIIFTLDAGAKKPIGGIMLTDIQKESFVPFDEYPAPPETYAFAA